jgi:MYXO-CTERM domain-containing protein
VAGACVNDCDGVVCPNNEVCVNGSCPNSIEGTGGDSGGVIILPDGGIIITGSGGTTTLADGGVITGTGGTASTLPDGGVISGTGSAGNAVSGSRTLDEAGSCGCRLPGKSSSGSLGALAALGVLAGFGLRRRRRSS